MASKKKTLIPIEFQKALRGMHYPANKADLGRAATANIVQTAMRMGVLDLIESLPDQEFEGPAAVQEAFGQLALCHFAK